MGGARWTLVSGIGLVGSIIYTIRRAGARHVFCRRCRPAFGRFLWGMLAIFLFAGIGNASTFKQMPMIFEPGVSRWRHRLDRRHCGVRAVPLRRRPDPHVADRLHQFGAAFAVLCIGITWVRYAR